MAKAATAKRKAPVWSWTPRPLAPLNPEEAERDLGDLVEVATERGLPRLATLLSQAGPARDFLAAAFDLSDFLRDCARRRPEMLDQLFDTTIADRLAAIDAEIAAAAFADGVTETALMATLRTLKLEAHFLIALADLGGESGPETTVHRLSDLADACVGAAVDFLLRDAHSQGKLKLRNPDIPSQGSGWIVLGMGKLGARELNFSSDIDLILFFDADAPVVSDPLEGTELFSRLARRLVRILQDRTGEGYVFRTDLRLRPDPGSTPLAIPDRAALLYYESRGQNWERAAMIKARPVAGDRVAADGFLAELKPYVWRK